MPNGIRPTSEKVRGALFEILKGRIEGVSFLDLYCGSGAIGIEALSRGAREVSFVDNRRSCIKTLKKNLRRLEILGLYNINIYIENVITSLKKFNRKKSMSFDIIFLDPPYYKDIAKNTLIAISNCDILTPNALLIIETYKKEDLPESSGSLGRVCTYRYGDTKLEFFNRITTKHR